MTTVLTTRRYDLLGQNIKGNPEMPPAHVAHDLLEVRSHADVVLAQEFEWASYWREFSRLLVNPDWRSFPNRAAGLAHPVQGGQPIFWRHRNNAGDRLLTADRSWKWLLHQGQAGISDDRWIRAVELVDHHTGLGFIPVTTHLVVGGDEAKDGPKRRAMMHTDLAHLEHALRALKRTGLPVVLELDGNIHLHSEAWAHFHEIVDNLGGHTYGELGVEYLVVFPAATSNVTLVVDRVWTLPNDKLYTDHEGRGLSFHLTGTNPAKGHHS